MKASTDHILFLLKTQGAQTAAALAQQLAITPVGVRQHLSALQQQALVVPEDRRETVGRPKRYWLLTEQAQQHFPDRHSVLTLELIQSVRAVFGEAGLEQLISQREAASLAQYQAALANCQNLQEKVAKLAEIRSAEGYMAHGQKNSDGSYLLLENHCPICAAARECQQFCRSELNIFQEVLGEDVKVERVEHVLDGARRCAYSICLH